LQQICMDILHRLYCINRCKHNCALDTLFSSCVIFNLKNLGPPTCSKPLSADLALSLLPTQKHPTFCNKWPTARDRKGNAIACCSPPIDLTDSQVLFPQPLLLIYSIDALLLACCSLSTSLSIAKTSFCSSCSPYTVLLLFLKPTAPLYNLTDRQLSFYSSCFSHTVLLLAIACCSPPMILLTANSSFHKLLLLIYSIDDLLLACCSFSLHELIDS
jgi:hypothetical protein